MLTISPEEAEELAFVPGALSEPRGAIYFCNNHCSEKAVRYWQFASMVVEEGGQVRTINFERRVQQGVPRLILWQGEDSWRGRHIVDEFGELWETSSLHAWYVGVLYRSEEDS